MEALMNYKICDLPPEYKALTVAELIALCAKQEEPKEAPAPKRKSK